MPVDAITAVGPEWQIAMPESAPVDGAAPAAGDGGDRVDRHQPRRMSRVFENICFAVLMAVTLAS